MKKKVLALISVVVCLAALFAFSACSINIDLNNLDGEEKSELTADNKEDSMTLINRFFEETLKDPNVVITTKLNGDLVSIETIEGKNNFVDYKATNVKFYGFVKDGEYYSATDGEGTQYYTKDKVMYDLYYCYFMSNIRVLEMLTEESGTFACELKYESKTESGVKNSTGSLAFTFTAESGTIKVTGTAKDDLVRSITFEVNDTEAGTTKNTVMTFEYGSASVTIPDISDWYDATATIVDE